MRRRLGALAAAAACVVVGVATRQLPEGLLANCLGVACYGAMWYALVIAVGPQMTLWKVAASALVICWSVEVFQLTSYPVQWARHDLFGLLSRMVLGAGFQVADLPSYPAGIAAAWVTHMRWRRARRETTSRTASETVSAG